MKNELLIQKTLIVLLLFAPTSGASIHAQAPAASAMSYKAPKLSIEEYHLKNGLHVVLNHQPAVPVVGVRVSYRVGLRADPPRRKGFSHLFEHLMFEGSKNYNDDYFKALSEAGAEVNGSAGLDMTNYWEIMPSNFLERSLFLEADRMANLVITQEKLDQQREVVKNELRQKVHPGTILSYQTRRDLYSPDYPYGESELGLIQDLDAASLDDVKSFFNKYYFPGNAVLVISGEFDRERTKHWVQKYFGPIKKGPKLEWVSYVAPELSGEIRKNYDTALEAPEVRILWRTPGQKSPDNAALDVLASLLPFGARNESREISGSFYMIGKPGPNKTFEEIEKEIDTAIDRIKQQPPLQADIDRINNRNLRKSILGLDTPRSMLTSLSDFALTMGRADGFQAEADQYLNLTPADIQRVATTYLTKNRLVVQVVPKKGQVVGSEENTKPTVAPAPKKESNGLKDYSANLPKPQADPNIVLPPIEKRKLPNGLNVWITRRNDMPFVLMRMVIGSGSSSDPAGGSDVAKTTAAFLKSGSKLPGLGVTVFGSVEPDFSWFSASLLSTELDKALVPYADMVINPDFSVTAVEGHKKQALSMLKLQKTDPKEMAGRTLNKLLYGPGHPYGRSANEESISAMSKQDLVDFYAANYIPDNSTLIVVGDVTGADLVPKLEKAFATWKPSSLKPADLGIPSGSEKPGIYLVDSPSVPQPYVSLGRIGAEYGNPDYFPIVIMNSMLGGRPTLDNRLGMSLREEKGYTYGALSEFNFRREAGPFTVSGSVNPRFTKEYIVELIRQLNGIRGAIPISQKELDKYKNANIRHFVMKFGPLWEVSLQLQTLAVNGLPDSFISSYVTNLQKVTLEDVNRVAKKYMDPEKMTIVVVGDRKKVEPGLRQLGMPVTILDANGDPEK